MADQNLDNVVSQSAQTQRDSYARNPVTPNAPADPDAPMSTGDSIGHAFSAIGDAAKYVAGAPARLVGSALGVPAYAGPITDAAQKAANAPTPVTTSISGNVRSSDMRSADSQASTLGISRDGPAASGPVANAAAPAPVGIARGDTMPAPMVGNATQYAPGFSPIDEANRSARAELNVMNARENEEVTRNRAASVLAGNEAQARFDGRNKAQADYVDHERDKNFTEWALNGSPRLLASYKQAEAAGGGKGPVSAAAGGVPPVSALLPTQTNFVQNAQAQNEAGSKALQQQLGMQKGQQELQSGAQGLQKGGIEIEHLKKQQSAIDELHAAKTPDAINVASQKLLAMQGKNPNEYDVKPVGGRIVTNPDGTTSTVGGYVAVVNKATGQTQLVGQPHDQQPQQPHPYEGQSGMLNGKRGKIINGQFVEDKQ